MVRSLVALIAVLALAQSTLAQSTSAASTLANNLQAAARNIPDACSTACKPWLTTLGTCPASATSNSAIAQFEQCVCTDAFISASSTCFACFTKAGTKETSLLANLNSVCGSGGASSAVVAATASAAVVNAAPAGNAAQPTTVIAGSVTIVMGMQTGGHTVTNFQSAKATNAANSGTNNVVVASGAESLLSSRSWPALAALLGAVAFLA